MGKLCAIIFAVCASWCLNGFAHADKRVALVVGNSGYQNVPRLANPANDAALIAAMLRNAGFDSVDSRSDLKAADLRRALREFGNASRNADVAVIYYAGHGVELDNVNYLIPVDTVLETDTDIYDETTPLERVLVAVEPAKRLRLVILDACRDNPFSKTMKRTVASRSVGRGLAKVEPASPNTIIAFAAKAGSTASDGDGKNSPFALALSKHLATPGLDLRKAFGFVRDDVLKTTGNKQEPYIYGSLGGEDVSLVPARPTAPAPAANPLADMRRDYELALQIGTRAVWSSFLNTYPTGFYADLAKGQLDKIAADEARVAAVERARSAQEEKAAAADQARLAAEKVAAEKAAAAKAEAVATAERQRLAAEQKDEPAKVASLDPPSDSVAASKSAPDSGALVKDIKKELQRVGCYSGAIDHRWDGARTSLGKFVKFAKLSGTTDQPDARLLDELRSRSSRVCPLECSPRQVESNGRCVARTCPPGSRLDDDGSCEKPREKAAARSSPAGASGAESGSARTVSRGGALGDAMKESLHVMPPGSIQTGQTMTLTARNGRKMTCTGGNQQQGVRRTCFWN